MPSTPPPSPSSSRDAARHLEHSHRIMGSPENCRIPIGPSIPSTSTPPLHNHSFRVQPANLSTRLPFIPPQHDGAQASTSAFTLAPPPIITSMAEARQTLSSAQLAAAFAALPPLHSNANSTLALSNITNLTAPAPSSHRQTLSSSQLAAAHAALPPFIPQSRIIPMGPPSDLLPQEILTPAQLQARFAALPPLNLQSRFVEHAVSFDISFLN